MNISCEKSRDSDDCQYAPTIAQIVVIRRCNLSCSYCTEFDHSSEPLDKGKIEQRLRKLRKLGTMEIEFTGGEPLLHHDISHFVSYAKDLGFTRVTVKTNGTLLNDAIVEAFNSSKLDALQLSIDAVNPNKSSLKATASMQKQLKLLTHAAQFTVIFSTVMGNTNKNELIELITTFQNRGYKQRILLQHGSDGQLNLSREECRTYQGLAHRFPELFSESADYRIKLLNGQKVPFKCRAGCKYLYVDESGIVRWCSQQQSRFGKNLMDYTIEDLKKQFHIAKPCTEKCTLGCARTNSFEWRHSHDPYQAQSLDL